MQCLCYISTNLNHNSGKYGHAQLTRTTNVLKSPLTTKEGGNQNGTAGYKSGQHVRDSSLTTDEQRSTTRLTWSHPLYGIGDWDIGLTEVSRH